MPTSRRERDFASKAPSRRIEAMFIATACTGGSGSLTTGHDSNAPLPASVTAARTARTWPQVPPVSVYGAKPTQINHFRAGCLRLA